MMASEPEPAPAAVRIRFGTCVDEQEADLERGPALVVVPVAWTRYAPFDDPGRDGAVRLAIDLAMERVSYLMHRDCAERVIRENAVASFCAARGVIEYVERALDRLSSPTTCDVVSPDAAHECLKLLGRLSCAHGGPAAHRPTARYGDGAFPRLHPRGLVRRARDVAAARA